jgi:hypothetical protein
MKKIKLTVTERKNGTYWVIANNVDFQLLRTSDGENEYLEVFPYEFPFRAFKLKTSDVSMDLLETMIAKELYEYTQFLIDL